MLSTKKFHYSGEELDLFQHAVHWKQYLANVIRPHFAGDVLEVGAGIGATSRALCDGTTKSWTCLEPDGAMAERLENDLRTTPLPVRSRVVCGYTSNQFKPESFDTVLYVDVLEHIEQDGKELARAMELLRPGGKLIVLSPAHQWLYTPFDKAIGHYRRYTSRSLRAIVPPNAKLSVDRYLDSVGMIASLANRLLLKARMPTAKQVWTWDSLFVPISVFLDRLLFFRVGKSILFVLEKEDSR